MHDEVQRLDMDVDKQIALLRPLGRGLPFDGNWTPLRVTRLKESRRRKIQTLCDWTSVAIEESVPVVSARGKAVLEPLLGEFAQWLPLLFDECDYWLLNLLRVIDAVDLDKSTVSRFSNGRISQIDEYALHSNVVSEELMFKASAATYDVLVGSRFRDLVGKHALTGFFFEPIWDSEHEPFRVLPGRDYIKTRPDVYGPEGFVTSYREFWPDEWREQERVTKLALKKGLSKVPK